MSVNDLVNDNYIILRTLYDNQVMILNEKQIPLTQMDLAKALGFSKNKVYSVFKMLQNNGYIESTKRGKYKLTSRAIYIVENIKEMEEMLNSEENM
mgnify:CR=1 FL=1